MERTAVALAVVLVWCSVVGCAVPNGPADGPGHGVYTRVEPDSGTRVEPVVLCLFRQTGSGGNSVEVQTPTDTFDLWFAQNDTAGGEPCAVWDREITATSWIFTGTECNGGGSARIEVTECMAAE